MAESVSAVACADMPGALNQNSTRFEFPEVHSSHARGSAIWSIAVSMHRIPSRIPSRILSSGDFSVGDPIVITREMRENHPIDDDRAPLMAVITTKIRTVREDGSASEQVFEPTFVIEGKNIGRANETNVYCQAMRNAYGTYLRHLRRANATSERPTPMLARVFSHDVLTPTVYVQRKYDGLRAIATLRGNEVLLYGRRGLEYVGFSHIRAEVARVCSAWTNGDLQREWTAIRVPAGRVTSLYLDGELYKHGMPLQAISGLVRRAEATAEQEELNYMVYDVFLVEQGAPMHADPTPFSMRLEILRAIGAHWQATDTPLRAIIIAETFPCQATAIGGTQEACARDLYARFLREGYEGAILRLDAPYEHSGRTEHHSSRLLKMKPLLDAEFRIVGWTTAAKGRARGALLFICETKDHIRFTVTPTGSLASRKQMMRDFDTKWRGKQLIVKFDELSTSGVPQRARTDGTIREIV